MSNKLEKINSLIRLANNNPNEHEANLAARKVCRMLESFHEWIMLGAPKTAADKINQARTWNDVTRSTEPQWRSKPQEPPDEESPFETIFEDMFRRVKYRPFTGGFDWAKAPHKDAPEEPVWGPESDHPKARYNPFTGEKEPRKQEIRKCVKCGLEIPTYRINENPWICNPCHWKDAF